MLTALLVSEVSLGHCWGVRLLPEAAAGGVCSGCRCGEALLWRGVLWTSQRTTTYFALAGSCRGGAMSLLAVAADGSSCNDVGGPASSRREMTGGLGSGSTPLL